MPSVAEKNTVPRAGVRSWGDELAVPGLTSATSTVPAALPSLFHSSVPLPGALVPLLAEKYTVVPSGTRLATLLLLEPGQMSFTSTVPASVPSLFHSSAPMEPPSALKNSVDPAAVMPDGEEAPVPGLMSLTCTVPASVPSLFHSSAPAASWSRKSRACCRSRPGCRGWSWRRRRG